MFRYQGCVIFLTIFVLYPLLADARCDIRFPGKAPLLFRNFGSRRVLQRNPKGMYLDVGEEIQVFCSSSLIAKWYRKWYGTEDNVQLATIQCTPSGVLFKEHGTTNNLEDGMELSCSRESFQLYESVKPLPNCQKYVSYGIGITPQNHAEITIGICYDLDTLSIKYAKYFTYKQNNNLLPAEQTVPSESIVHLDLELKNFESVFTLISNDEVQKSYASFQSNNILLQGQNFDFDSLIQGRDNGNYNGLFKVMWWQNLRSRNWFYFMNALKERSENVTYTTYTGISGVVTVPSLESCDKNGISELRLSINGKSTKAPALIYSYLKTFNAKEEEEFVVVAYNTPFLMVNNGTEICKDMCDDIDWLKKSLFGRTHLMPAYGVVVCCHPAELVGKIENFPFVQNDEENVIEFAVSTEIPSE